MEIDEIEIIIHRVNKIKNLSNIPLNYGCEVDIRSYGNELILNHEPYLNGDLLKDYLENYHHGTLVLNIKEAGIENDVLEMVRKNNIKDYFLLDVEFPYIYNQSRKGERSIALRFSEDEPIEFIVNYMNKVDWVWIDTNSKLPLNKKNISILKEFKTCLVCPERWNRPEDIKTYKNKLLKLGFKLDAVMTNINYSKLWEQKN